MTAQRDTAGITKAPVQAPTGPLTQMQPQTALFPLAAESSCLYSDNGRDDNPFFSLKDEKTEASVIWTTTF